MSWVATGIGVGTAAAGFISSAHKAKKDKEEQEALKVPFYQIQQGDIENKNQAEQLAGQGMTTDTKNFLTQQNQQGLSASLGAIKQTGGGVNDLSHLLQGYQNSLRGIGADDSQQHIENIKYFHKLNADLAGQKTTQWSINNLQPYEAKLKQLQEAEAADQQNEWNAINTGASAAIGATTGNANAALLKKLLSSLGNKSGGTPQIQGPYTPGVANTAGSVVSPASNYPTINPNAGADVVAGNGADLQLPTQSIEE